MGTLNIIAKSPRNPTERDPLGGVLDEIIQRFQDEQIPFERAATVRDVVDKLKAANRAGDVELVQIIGHGCPGVLSLGSVWAQEYKEPGKFGSAYVIDSNPYAYSMLEPYVADGTTIALIGCWVGDDSRPRTQIPDGTTLLFDLARMLDSPVMAALCAVQPTDFIDGLFRGPMRVSDGRFVNGSTCPTTQSTPTAERVHFLRVDRIPIVGPLVDRLDAPISMQDASTLHNGYTRSVTLGRILAFPEIELTVSVDFGPECKAHVLGRGRYLRVFDGNVTKHFTVPQQSIFGVDGVLSKIIKSGIDRG